MESLHRHPPVTWDSMLVRMLKGAGSCTMAGSPDDSEDVRGGATAATRPARPPVVLVTGCTAVFWGCQTGVSKSNGPAVSGRNRNKRPFVNLIKPRQQERAVTYRRHPQPIMSTSPVPEGEDPADLLDRTNLAAYLSARKQLAAENSQLGLPTRPVLPGVLRTDETVSKAMELLSSLRVQAAPLVAMHADNQHYDAQAFISCGDLVLGFLERVNSSATATRDANVLDRMAALTAVGQAYSSTKLVDIRSRWDGTGVWSTATEDMSLADALRRCMHIGEEHRNEPGSPMLRQCPHRFAVIDASGMVVDIVAQSDLAMYLRRNADLLDQTVMNATLQSMNLGSQGSRRVVSVNASTPTVDCFYEMERANVQAVAIIDENTDALIGNLSETDIMTLKSDAYGALALPVGEYLLHAHSITNPKIPDIVNRTLYNPDSTVFSAALANEGSRLVVTCEPGATIAEVLDAMHVKAVHRVWVVDDAGRPVGVVALSDILAAIAVKKPAGVRGTSEGTMGKSTMHAAIPTPTSQSSA